MILNTIVADVLSEFADKLEKSANFTEDLNKLIKDTITEHKHIIFNGNNYSDEWVVEAEKRGLSNLKTTVDALPKLVDDKNVALFTKFGVLSESEVHSRYEINLENYVKTINIEALTMVEMANKEIIPAVVSYMKVLSDTAAQKKAVSDAISVEFETALLEKLSALVAGAYEKAGALEAVIEGIEASGDVTAQATYVKDQVLPAMDALREKADALEPMVAKKYWPYPTYGELLFY
jgi:glutamine synthetase